MGYFKIYPNLYVILVAESAKCRKSSALRIGTGILDLIDDGPAPLAEDITPEAVISDLEATGMQRDEQGEAKNSECVISAEELSVFLREDAFRSGIAALLTRFYDTPDKWKKKTKTGGPEALHDVVVNLFAATTPTDLRQCFPHSAEGGGFLSRFIFVHSNKSGAIISRPKVTQKMLQTKSDLIHDLSAIRQLRGECVMTEEAGEFYDRWYNKWMKDTEEASGYEPKKHTFVLKLAMVLSACRSNKLDLTFDDINAALKYLTELEPGMKEVRESIWMSPVGELCEKILKLIRSCKQEGIMRSALLNRATRFVDAEMLTRVITTLDEAELIEVETMRRGKIAYGQRYTAK